MLPKYRQVLVVLLAGPVLDLRLRAFLASYSEFLPGRAELVVPTDVLPDVRDAVQKVGGVVVPSPKPNFPHLRAADVIARAARSQPDRPVLVADPDLIFQTDRPLACCDPVAVTLAAEPGTVKFDVWNRENFTGFSATLPPPLVCEDLGDLRIVSRAAVAGPARPVALFELCRFATGARVSKAKSCDQAVTTALADWSQGGPWVKVVEPEEVFVAFGHWAAATGLIVEQGVARSRRTGQPYAMFHGWDRVPAARKAIEAKYRL
jgi:hypothetical protein